ncbi:hypothetical protein AVEN_195596-1 [Araneus ventricosus]|uniref:Uncharacterized protein n=1 Tax=Araneus ventricosus TaxID=182803 RepID=A0A4Y2BB73_ARAVE|nr:hypothetical protein AVEN_195596-1 [Araneus ventricosus]
MIFNLICSHIWIARATDNIAKAYPGLKKSKPLKLFKIYISLLKVISSFGHVGLVVRSRLRGLRDPGLKPDSTEDPPCVGAKQLSASMLQKFGERGASSDAVLVM